MAINKQRIIGFDLARAYAILGMFIVNYNIVFGNFENKTGLGYFLSMFSGNSSTVFVMLAGMGLALMSNRNDYNSAEKSRLRNNILKRALFLFVLGILLQTFWPADILHFYAAYMSVGACIIFLNRKFYLWISGAAVAIFHILFFLIPFDTYWNFETFEYNHFWTFSGFLTNYLYNGWNAVFPWLAFFTTGMYLGRLNWQHPKTHKRIFVIGLALYLVVLLVQILANAFSRNIQFLELINADYLPPMLPFILSTTGFGFMLIAAFMYLGNLTEYKKWAKNIAAVGQMTLTHYILHLTLGLFLFAGIFGKDLTTELADKNYIAPEFILIFSLAYFIFSILLTKIWKQKFKNGPFEALMRKVSG